MKTIKVKTPAKINLSLKVGKKRPDGFHPIESVMQTISLFDFLTIELFDGEGKINLSGTSAEIPYDERNIAYKAAKEFMKASNLKFDLNIYIEKNIPVAAGLAGGSTNASGVLFGLNKMLGQILSSEKIFEICKNLGSDLNFCMAGGKKMCRGKGDELSDMPYENFPVTIIKPRNFGISTALAYKAFDELEMESNMPNDLEFALLPKYKELQFLHAKGFQMSGSGPTYFALKSHLDCDLGEDFQIIDNLTSINYGVAEI